MSYPNQNLPDGLNPLGYLGVQPSTPSQSTIQNVDPTTKDAKDYKLTTHWLNKANGTIWELIDKTSPGGALQATWVKIYPSLGNINGLVDSFGTVVVPDVNADITIAGGDNINTTSAASTIIVSLNGSVALPATIAAATSGVIAIGTDPAVPTVLTTDRFIHSYGLKGGVYLENCFIGHGSGNFTLTTAQGNTGCGEKNLEKLSTGSYNTTAGYSSGTALTSGVNNAFYGALAGVDATSGSQLSFFGSLSGTSVVDATDCVGIGYRALENFVTGIGRNVAVGNYALGGTSTGNVAIGCYSLAGCTVSPSNTAVGESSLLALTGGFGSNTALGFEAGKNLVSGDGNLLLGSAAGSAYVGAESNNICLDSSGVAGDSQVIRIGVGSTSTYIQGIANVSVSNELPVFIDSLTGQLGTGVSTGTMPITWTRRDSKFELSDIASVAYGNGYWVAVGDAGKLSYATDATDVWTLGAPGFPADYFTGVAYGNGYWVAVGQSGNLFTAIDPTGVWTSRVSGFGASTIHCVDYGADGYWVIAGAAGKLFTATDPTGAWTSRVSGFGANPIQALAYGNGYWVTVGLNGTLGVATDPTGVWTVGAHGIADLALYDVAYGDGYWVTVGIPSNNGYVFAYAIDPTVNWITRDRTISNVIDILLVVGYGNGCWVAGNNCYTVDHPDQVWTKRIIDIPENGNAIAYNDNTWVMVARKGQLITAIPGI